MPLGATAEYDRSGQSLPTLATGPAHECAGSSAITTASATLGRRSLRLSAAGSLARAPSSPLICTLRTVQAAVCASGFGPVAEPV